MLPVQAHLGHNNRCREDLTSDAETAVDTKCIQFLIPTRERNCATTAEATSLTKAMWVPIPMTALGQIV